MPREKMRMKLNDSLQKQFPLDSQKTMTTGTTDKAGCVFLYMKLDDTDQTWLAGINITDELVLDIIDSLLRNGYTFKISPMSEHDTYKVAVTGTVSSYMPMHCVIAEATEYSDALVSVFYKMRLCGYPDVIRTSQREEQPRQRFN